MSKRSEDEKSKSNSAPAKRVTLKQLQSKLVELQIQSETQSRTLKHKVDVLIDKINLINISLSAIRPKKKVSLVDRFSIFSSRYNLRLLVSASLCLSMAAFGIFWLFNSM